jgi:hypothetical protein
MRDYYRDCYRAVTATVPSAMSPVTRTSQPLPPDGRDGRGSGTAFSAWAHWQVRVKATEVRAQAQAPGSELLHYTVWRSLRRDRRWDPKLEI